MTHDYTAAIAELSAAYQANRVANASIAAEVKAKYKAMMDAEIRDRRYSADKEFADHMAAVKDKTDMPLTVIQEYVLHTKAWNRWVYWRDLAGIPAERVTAGLERDERNKQYRFEKFVYRGTERDAILWLKDKKGKTLDTPLRAYVVWDFLDFPDLDRDQEDYRKSVGYGFEEFTRLTGAIIKEHYEGKEQGE